MSTFLGSNERSLHFSFLLPSRDHIRAIAFSTLRRNDIFICYSSKESNFVRVLDESLRRQGVDPWIDTEDILDGDDQWDQIQDGINNANTFVLVIGSSFPNDEEVQTEFNVALEKNKLIILVVLPSAHQLENLPGIPHHLTWNVIEHSTYDDDPITHLAKAILHIQTYVRLLARSIVWDEKARSVNLLLNSRDYQAVQKSNQWVEENLGGMLNFEPIQREFLDRSNERIRHFHESKYHQQTTIDIFISYSSKDRQFVQDIYDALCKEGLNVWVDWNNIPVAADWRQEVENAIQVAHTFIFVISPDSVVSQHCNYEIEQATYFKKRCIPVLYRANYSKKHFEATGLHRVQRVPFDGQDFEQAIVKLSGAISSNLEDVKTHNQLLRRAIEWDATERKSFLLSSQELKKAQKWRDKIRVQRDQNNFSHIELSELQENYLNASRKAIASRNHLRRIVGVSLIIGFSIISLAISAVKRGEIRALVASLEERKGLDAMLTALLAGKRLHDNRFIRIRYPQLHFQTVTALHQQIINLRELSRLEGHTGRVFGLAFSPNGQLIASAGEDRTVRLWDSQGNSVGDPLIGHQNSVISVAFSPDGQLLASASHSGYVNLWHQKCKENSCDLSTTPWGIWKTLFRNHRNQAISVMFSPGGRYLVSTGDDGNIHLWDRENDFREPLILNHKRRINADDSDSIIVSGVSFDQYSDRLASASFDQAGTLKIWHLDGTLVATMEHGSPVFNLVFSPDGRVLASAARNGTIKLWNKEGALLHTLEGHEDRVHRVAFNRNGQILASVGQDGSARLWNVNTGEQIHLLRGHQNAIYRVRFSPDSQILATGGADDTIKLWSVDSGQLIDELEGHNDEILGLDFSPELTVRETDMHDQTVSTLLASASTDGTVRLWTVRGSRKLLAHNNRIFDIAFHPDGRVLASSGVNTIRFWKQSQAEDSFQIGRSIQAASNNSSSNILSISYSPDGQFLISGDADGHLKLWSPNNHKGMALKQIQIRNHAINQVRFNADGTLIASGSSRGDIQLWDQNLNAIGRLNQKGIVTSVVFVPNSTLLIASGQSSDRNAQFENSLKVWDLSHSHQEAKPLQTIRSGNGGHYANITSLAVNPSGDTLVSGDAEGQLKLWRIQNNSLHLLKSWQTSRSEVRGISFSFDGQLFITGSQDGIVRIWKSSGEQISELRQHQREISSIYFYQKPIQSGMLFASSGLDDRVYLWTLPKDFELNTFELLLDDSCELIKTYLASSIQDDSDSQGFNQDVEKEVFSLCKSRLDTLDERSNQNRNQQE